MSTASSASHAGTVLVTGASGRLGPLLLSRLLARGVRVRALSRDPQAAQARLADLPGIDWVAAEFENRASLQRALQGVERVILLSPITSTLAAQQGAVIEEAGDAGVQRIVKLSGSDWTIVPAGASLAGTAHADIERQLAASGLAWASVRPNAWAQNIVAGLLESLARGEPVTSGHGEVGVSYVDTRDIADVLVTLLLGDALPDTPLVLTGPAALTGRDLAACLSRLSGRTVSWQPLSADEQQARLAASGVSPFLQTVRAQFALRVRAGAAAPVTDHVERWLRRPARSIDALLAEQLAEKLAERPATPEAAS